MTAPTKQYAYCQPTIVDGYDLPQWVVVFQADTIEECESWGDANGERKPNELGQWILTGEAFRQVKEYVIGVKLVHNDFQVLCSFVKVRVNAVKYTEACKQVEEFFKVLFWVCQEFEHCDPDILSKFDNTTIISIENHTSGLNHPQNS